MPNREGERSREGGKRNMMEAQGRALWLRGKGNHAWEHSSSQKATMNFTPMNSPHDADIIRYECSTQIMMQYLKPAECAHTHTLYAQYSPTGTEGEVRPHERT